MTKMNLNDEFKSITANRAKEKKELDFILDYIEFKTSKGNHCTLGEFKKNPNFNQETLQLVAQGARLLQLLGDDWKEKMEMLKNVNTQGVYDSSTIGCFVRKHSESDGCRSSRTYLVCDNAKYCDKKNCALKLRTELY
jgi:hypothetical protein